MKKPETFTELLNDAYSLFDDVLKDIADLIYWAVSLGDEERSALI